MDTMLAAHTPCDSHRAGAYPAVPGRVGGLIRAAGAALTQGRAADAFELVAAAAVQDIQHEGMTLLASAAGAGVLADLYQQVLAQGLTLPSPPSTPPRWGIELNGAARQLRVLYVHPGLSPGQAATDRLLNVVERHARRGRVVPMVLLAEEFTARVPRSRVLQWPDVPSREHKSALARLKDAGVEVFTTPTLGSLLDSARAAVTAARAMRPDVAVFIASSACPVQAAMALERVAPVQINQNIGSPLLVRGIDAVIYRNPARLRQDREELARREIKGIDLPASGTDLDAADAAQPVSRGSIGVPRDGFLMVTAGNKVPERLLMGTFAADLAAFLQKQPKAWWMGVGPGDMTRAMAPFKRAGVQNRVVLPGGQADIRPWLKAADVYLNEYPEGGSNTVLEAAACGVPVIAVRSDDCGENASHCAGIGGEIIGDDAVALGGYWDRAALWLRDTDQRRHAAARIIARARERFGFDALTSQYEDVYLSAAGDVATGYENGPSA